MAPNQPSGVAASTRLPATPGDSATFVVAQLAVALGVKVGWRPWRRRRLSLAELRNVELALGRTGCLPAAERAVPRALDAAITVLCPARPDEDGWRRRVRRLTFLVTARIVAAVSFTASVITLWLVVFAPAPQPQQLGGDLNFAVVPFHTARTATAADRSATRALAQTLAASLKRTLARRDPNVAVDARAADPVGGAAADRAELARLAERINADAVIFGEVATTAGGAVVTPYVYVA